MGPDSRRNPGELAKAHSKAHNPRQVLWSLREAADRKLPDLPGRGRPASTPEDPNSVVHAAPALANARLEELRRRSAAAGDRLTAVHEILEAAEDVRVVEDAIQSAARVFKHFATPLESLARALAEHAEVLDRNGVDGPAQKAQNDFEEAKAEKQRRHDLLLEDKRTTNRMIEQAHEAGQRTICGGGDPERHLMLLDTMLAMLRTVRADDVAQPTG